MINWSWALHVHGPAPALAAFTATMADPGRPALFQRATATAVDATSWTYHGKAALPGDDQLAQVVALSVAHPDLTLAALTNARPHGIAATLTSYRGGARQGYSRSDRYNALSDGAIAWLPAGGSVAYWLSNGAAAVPVAATGAGLFAALSDVVGSTGARTALSVRPLAERLVVLSHRC